MKILICEDNRLAMRALSVFLGKEGFDTVNAIDGNEAMELLNTNEYDLVLIDIHLPYHSGLELIRHLRSDLKKKTPVIVVSAFSDPQVQRQAHELGINDYIVKPVDPTDLIEKIRTLLRN
jgi:DNA-binding response OmpR family regulator